MKTLSLLILLSAAVSAEVPKVFEGLFEKEVPVRASIGMVVPPPEIEKYIAKVQVAARKNPEWFREFTASAKPGTPLPYHENLGLTKAEYDEYLAIWAKRKFEPKEDVMLVLRETFGDTWSLTASGEAGAISTLRYDPKTDTFRSPNGVMKRLEDINADKDSILGEWSGKEWRFEETTGLGKTKENFAIGKFGDTGFGIVVYRAQEISTEGNPAARQEPGSPLSAWKSRSYETPHDTSPALIDEEEALARKALESRVHSSGSHSDRRVRTEQSLSDEPERKVLSVGENHQPHRT